MRVHSAQRPCPARPSSWDVSENAVVWGTHDMLSLLAWQKEPAACLLVALQNLRQQRYIASVRTYVNILTYHIIILSL